MAQDEELAAGLSVNASPFLFVNGVAVRGASSIEDLGEMIELQREAAGAAPAAGCPATEIAAEMWHRNRAEGGTRQPKSASSGESLGELRGSGRSPSAR